MVFCSCASNVHPPAIVESLSRVEAAGRGSQARHRGVNQAPEGLTRPDRPLPGRAGDALPLAGRCSTPLDRRRALLKQAGDGLSWLYPDPGDQSRVAAENLEDVVLEAELLAVVAEAGPAADVAPGLCGRRDNQGLAREQYWRR